MTIEQAEEFFQKEGYQSKETALVETSVERAIRRISIARWASWNHEAARRHEDETGRGLLAGEVSRRFSKAGISPVKIVREALLGDDSPTL